MRSAEYATLLRVEDAHWWYRQMRRVLRWHLERFAPDWRERAILDAGCGTGGNLAQLEGRGRRVGLDYAPEALAGCRTRGLPELVRGSVTALPFADGSFGAVLSISVLYHEWVRDPAAALRELRRVLAPGGLLLVDVPGYRSLTSPHDEAVMTARRFTAGELRALVEASGFEVLRVTHWMSLLFPAIWLARRLRVFATGRDFETTRPEPGGRNAAMDLLMRAEAALLRRVPLPIGVSIHCAARRAPDPDSRALPSR
ncbi:MAG: methyltransferase type 11 [Proteobacteria bacterium]|nr:MAG: methyltransferase type 11 [Pseudomonadota bacterium]